MNPFDLATQVLLLAVLLAAAVTDVSYRKVPHWITLPAIAFGLTLAWAGHDGAGLLSSVYGLLIACAVFGTAYLAGGVGGGDLKLVAAVGALKGAPFIVDAIFWSGLVGMIMAVSVLAWRGRLGFGLRRAATAAFSIRGPVELPADDPAAYRLPYGVAIAFGTLLAFFLKEGLA